LILLLQKKDFYISNFISDKAKLGKEITFAKNVIIEDNVNIGDNCRIGYNVVIRKVIIISEKYFQIFSNV